MENLDPKEKMFVVAFLKDYFKKLVDLMQKQSTTMFGNNPMLLNKVNKELKDIKYWIELEIAALGLSDDMVELAVVSNYTWKNMNEEKKLLFKERLKIFLLNDDAIIYLNDKYPLTKPMTFLLINTALNNLNS